MNDADDDARDTIRGTAQEPDATDGDLDTATIAPSVASPVDAVAPATKRERPTLATGGGGKAGDASGTRLGDHLLIEMIGRGGMGAVYLARQEALDREVAVKTVLAQHAGQAFVEAAFVSEAKVTGELEHPGIVPVHHLGRTEDGRPYMSMKLVRGTEWSKLLRDGAPLRQHLDILLKVCDAVAFAHSRHVLHRDLKPANVMVGEFGEVQVMDWGIAISLGENVSSKTMHRSAVRSEAGTPAYMAPEMAKPDPERLGPPSDVYLLGAILYEILTGTPPHRGSDARAVLEAARTGAVEAPQERAPGRRVPAELGRIAVKALAPDPVDRFATASALAAAVRDYLSHEDSLKLAEEAGASLAALATPGAVAPAERYATYAGALSRLDEALHLWPDNEDAVRTRARAALDYADEALARGDAGLAAAQLPQIRASAHAAPDRRDALAAALAAQASARGRMRLALAFIAVFVVAVYAALGGTRQRVLDAEAREAARARLGRTLAEAWAFVRAADVGGLAGPAAALNDPALTALDDYAERVQPLEYARAILLWQRERWEELSEHVALRGRPPAWPPVPVALKTDAGRPAAGRPCGRPWTDRDFAFYPPLVQVVLSDPKVMPYVSQGLRNGRTGELLASLARAASYGEPPAVLDAAVKAARDLTGEAKAPPEARRWFALGVAAIYGQAYRAAQARGDAAALAALEPARLPFRLSLPKRPPGPTPEGFSWQETPAQIGFDPSDREWLKLSADAAGLGFHYRASRRAAHVALAVPADDGTAFVLTARAAARLDWAPRQVTARTALAAAPVLGWPDPIDRAKLQILLADDGEPRAENRVIDDPDKLAAFLARGGLSSLDDGEPLVPAGAVRLTELSPGLAAWPTIDVTGTRAFIMQTALMPPEFDRIREPDYGRKLGTMFSHAGQDRTDVHAAVFVLVHGRTFLSPGAIDYLVNRIRAAAPALSTDDEAQAAVLLEHAGHASTAHTLLADAVRRQRILGNPLIARGAATASLLRQVSLARLDAAPSWALEVLDASLAFAAHDAADAALVARLAARPDGAELRERLATPAPASLDARLRVWKRGGAAVALSGALVALVAIAGACRRARATRLADLYGLGWRTAGDRALAFLTHPVARMRHVWTAYAPRSTRALVSAAVLVSVAAVAVAATASRLQEQLALFGDNPANNPLTQGEVWRALRERRDLGSRSPALLAACAAAERARHASLVPPAAPGPEARLTAAELQDAALDPLVVRRELVRTFVLTAFDPAASLARLRDALAPRLAPFTGARAAVPAASALTALVTILAAGALVGGLLAFVWLPLAVRPRLARAQRQVE